MLQVFLAYHQQRHPDEPRAQLTKTWLAGPVAAALMLALTAVELALTWQVLTSDDPNWGNLLLSYFGYVSLASFWWTARQDSRAATDAANSADSATGR